ncbi:MAG: phosphatidylglycerophosphate synthase, partial [Clostridia bacterium]|nr:phosphatidylglycerophosphate synthase [Clostridia bacterium]
LYTTADTVFTVSVIIKIVRAVPVPIWIIVWIIIIAIIKSINLLGGFIIYKQLVFEHTVMNKICGVLLFCVPLCIGNFPQEAVTVLIIITCAVATFAAIQEGHYVCTGKEID